MRKHKTKIIIAAVIIAVLAIAWIYDGSLTPNTGGDTSAHVAAAEVPTQLETVVGSEPEQAAEFSEIYEPTVSGDLLYSEPDSPTEQMAETEEVSDTAETAETEDASDTAKSTEADEASDTAEVQPEPTTDLAAAPESQAAHAPAQTPPETPTIQILGEEHPESREPVDPENVEIGDGSFYITLSVRVDMILHNMHLLNREKHELVPDDGVIFPVTRVRAYEGESVFNVLQREMRRARIHMASRFTPIFNSAYVEAINNLYEFDVGPLSGWMYSVNGWFPNFGSSRYLLSPDDVVEWHFTVDLGRDLGVYWIDGGQRNE